MVKKTINKNSNPKCFQCSSDLIFVSEVTVQPEGTRYPQTNTVYRCSNDECQKKKDKDKADRFTFKLNQALNQKQRLERIQENRKLRNESKVEN